MADAPMKPTKTWAHVDKATGKVTYVCDPEETKDEAKAWMTKRERLVRVVITEKEANHAE